jgi:hypothetical protein
MDKWVTTELSADISENDCGDPSTSVSGLRTLEKVKFL